LSDFPRSILEFQQRFGDDDACRRYLFASRWPDGVSCPRCGGARARAQPERRMWECRPCGHQTSGTAGGGDARHPHTPLQLWFWPPTWWPTHHPGISAVQLKRQLGIARYDTA
jgi:ribosomal protein L37AE/L43A